MSTRLLKMYLHNILWGDLYISFSLARSSRNYTNVNPLGGTVRGN